ncbi:MAG: hypothetical protein FWG63_07020 [Defluviitaleaceae bacterium]|nr:hypothetical protein [Defluviitaleaceae bacterium]
MIKKIIVALLFLSLPVTALANPVADISDVRNFAGVGNHGFQNYPAQFNLPYGIAYSGGYLFIADTHNNLIRSVSSSGEVSVVAGEIAGFDLFGFALGGFFDGGVAYARFDRPVGIAVGEQGIFVSDSNNHAIRLIQDDGVTTFFYQETEGQEPEGLNFPTAIVLGEDGELFVADTNNHAIRVISPSGTITTVAGTIGQYGHEDGYQATFNYPMGIALLDSYLFVSDTGNNTIRRVYLPTGYVTTIAGQILWSSEVADWYLYDDQDIDNIPLGGFQDGYDAMFNLPIGLVVIGEDLLLVADSGNHAIRAINLTQEMYVTTIAGTGVAGHYNGDAQEAMFHFPTHLAFGTGNVLFVADTWNNMIRALEIEILD